MNFLADENVDLPVVNKLRENNYHVDYVAELQPGIPDKGILQIANKNDEILITTDKDFGELVFRQKLINKGVILLRLHGLNTKLKASILLNFIEKHGSEITNSFSVISINSIRIRKSV